MWDTVSFPWVHIYEAPTPLRRSLTIGRHVSDTGEDVTSWGHMLRDVSCSVSVLLMYIYNNLWTKISPSVCVYYHVLFASKGYNALFMYRFIYMFVLFSLLNIYKELSKKLMDLWLLFCGLSSLFKKLWSELFSPLPLFLKSHFSS